MMLNVCNQELAWAEKLLCRRYAAVVFSTARTTVRNGGAVFEQPIHWALGGLDRGEHELLGAWAPPDPDGAAASTFHELYLRGAEFVRFSVGEFPMALSAATTGTRVAGSAPSVEQMLAATLAPLMARHRSVMGDRLREISEASDLEAAFAVLSAIERSNLGERYPAVMRQWREALARLEPLFALPESLRSLVRSADRTAMEVHERLTTAIHRHGPFVDAVAAREFVASALQRAERRLDHGRLSATVRSGTPAALRGRRLPGSGPSLAVPALV